VVLDARSTKDSFLLETLSYLFGGRFVTYLASTYGVEPVLSWYGDEGYQSGFRRVFGKSLEEAWADFERAERDFQRQNVECLESASPTPVESLRDQAMGWISQPGLDREQNVVVFASHGSHHLASIKMLELGSGAMREVATLPTPSLIGVASTAFDPELGLFFYTTNNNQLYRDVQLLDLSSGESKTLFKDARVGELTVASETHELWGVRHAGGVASLVYSAHPYDRLDRVSTLRMGDSLHHLAISPSGRLLAATVHQSTGRQAIIVADIESLRKEGKLTYQTISEEGSPEFPSWSPDEAYIYWNAYTNGVSNIYRYRRAKPETQAMSHTLRGVFRPLFLDEDSLFAFEFTTDGFVPVRIPNRAVSRLPAIRYFGQEALNANPELIRWVLSEDSSRTERPAAEPTRYSGSSELQLHSLLPVVSGFGDRLVVGVYGHVADPLSFHDITFEGGVSTHGKMVHFRGSYQYKGQYRLEVEHNPSSFYDLFNERKKGWRGTKVGLSHSRFVKFDMPHEIQQTTQVAWYSGIETIEDNLVEVSTPDVVMLETNLSSRNVRRSVGSVDSESGNTWSTSLTALGAHGRGWDLAAGLHGEWDRFLTWGRPHNVLHTQVAAGYRHAKDDLEVGHFYFGGFGNQHLEDQAVKQYRQTFRFPGVPVSSLSARRFAKVTVEHNLPPLRFGNVGAGGHFLSHIDASWFTQGLALQSEDKEAWMNLGAQINLVFRLWSNLESTVSVGFARAWNGRAHFDEWFFSVKLLRG
jgi:hypothetical protein